MMKLPQVFLRFIKENNLYIMTYSRSKFFSTQVFLKYHFYCKMNSLKYVDYNEILSKLLLKQTQFGWEYEYKTKLKWEQIYFLSVHKKPKYEIALSLIKELGLYEYFINRFKDENQIIKFINKTPLNDMLLKSNYSTIFFDKNSQTIFIKFVETLNKL